MEDAFHLHGHIDGVARQLEIEIVGEQGIELESDECALGNDGTVLLLDGEEMLVGLSVGEDDGLATEGANLGSTDVENVAVACKIG